MDETVTVDDSVLIASAKRGDGTAFALLAERYHGLLKSCVSSLPVSAHDKEDLMQEALIGLMRAVRSYDGVSSKFSTYVSACVRNSIVTWLRRYGKQRCEIPYEDVQQLALRLEQTTPEIKLVDIESTSQLHDKAFSVLSPFERTVFEMYLAEIPYAVMAKKLNKNEKSIDNAMQRIKAKLKKLV